MDKIVDIFIKYLEKSSVDIENEILERASKRIIRSLTDEDTRDIQRITERKNAIRLLKVPKEEWPLHGEVFIQFEYISEMLEKAPLNARGKFSIILRLLEKNLSTNIVSEDARCFDIQGIDEYNFSYMTREQFLEFVRTDEYGKLKSKEESELTEHERKMLDEFETFSDLYPLDIAPVIEKHKLIKEHYFDKKDSFDIEDIEIFLEAIKSFGVDDSLITMFRQILLKDISKREVKNSEVVPNILVKPTIVEDRISQKEYNLLNRELKRYFDLTDMICVKPLLVDEQIYCVSLMIKMGISDIEIKKALKVMNKNNVHFSNEENPLVVFSRLYSRMNYYKDNDLLQDAIRQIMELFKEVFICNDEDYLVIRELIGEELNQTLQLIPNTYEYEIEEAKKIAKSK